MAVEPPLLLSDKTEVSRVPSRTCKATSTIKYGSRRISQTDFQNVGTTLGAVGSPNKHLSKVNGVYCVCCLLCTVYCVKFESVKFKSFKVQSFEVQSSQSDACSRVKQEGRVVRYENEMAKIDLSTPPGKRACGALPP